MLASSVLTCIMFHALLRQAEKIPSHNLRGVSFSWTKLEQNLFFKKEGKIYEIKHCASIGLLDWILIQLCKTQSRKWILMQILMLCSLLSNCSKKQNGLNKIEFFAISSLFILRTRKIQYFLASFSAHS